MDAELSSRASRLVALSAAVLLAGVGLWAGLRGLGYPRQLNLRAPELSGLPASDVARAAGRGPRLARRVVLFIADGLTLSAARDLPSLEELRVRGASYEVTIGFPTFSTPAYHTLLTGVDPGAGGVRLNGFPTASRFDSLPARARAAGLRTAAVANSVPWLGDLFGSSFDLTVAGAGFERALHRALDPRYGFVVVLFGEADRVAHVHGARTPAYRAAARRVDARIGRAVAAVDLRRDTVVVVSDHGQVARGGHGGMEPAVYRVPLVLAGAGVRRGVQGEGRLVDVAPTIAALLGLSPPGQHRGWPLMDALEVTERERAAVWQAMFWARTRSERFLGGLWRARRALDVKRDEALQLLAAGHDAAAYRAGRAIVREETARAEKRGRDRAADAIRGRALRAAGILVLAVILLLVLGRRRVIEPGAATFLVLLGPALMVGAYLAWGETFSFSTIRDRTVFIAHVALCCVGAVAVQFLLLAVALGRRGPRRARRAAGLAAWATLVAALPAVACYVVVGPGPVVDLPPPTWAFAPIVAYPFLGVTAGASTLFALLEGRARE